MDVVQVISEHKKIKKNNPLENGYKRVEAIVKNFGILVTKHIDIKK